VVRALSLLVWLLVALPMLLPLLRSRRPASPAGEGTARDELVKDPVCQTYVVRSRAVRRTGRDGTRYFCSSACAKRYLPS
jgi:YHS domain-containing protein